jgi:seryl-tRNA(Sec) selenium transferase
MSAGEIEHRLRLQPTPVIARIARDGLILDMRTVRDEELGLVTAALASIRA